MSQQTTQSPPLPGPSREPATGPHGAKKLPGLPRRPLSPQEQLLALRRVQAQAEQRLKLGGQVFRAAQAQSLQHASLLEQLRQEQVQLRNQMQEDFSRSIRQYDQYIHHLDQDVTGRLEQIEKRLEDLHANWASTESKVAAMLQRAEALLDQSRCLLQIAPIPVETERPVHSQAITFDPIPPQEIPLDQTPAHEPEPPEPAAQLLQPSEVSQAIDPVPPDDFAPQPSAVAVVLPVNVPTLRSPHNDTHPVEATCPPTEPPPPETPGNPGSNFSSPACGGGREGAEAISPLPLVHPGAGEVGRGQSQEPSILAAQPIAELTPTPEDEEPPLSPSLFRDLVAKLRENQGKPSL